MLWRKKKGPLDKVAEKVNKLHKKLKDRLGRKDKDENKVLKTVVNALVIILIKMIGDRSGGSSARGKL